MTHVKTWPIWPLIAATWLTGCNGSSENPGSESPNSTSYIITGTLNDTGVTMCASATQVQQPCPQEGLPGQDPQFGRDAAAPQKAGAGVASFDWTKLDATGAPLATQNLTWSAEGTEAEGTRWSCVRDHVSGLFWEVKESDGQHPRYGGHTYRWWLEGDQHNGGYTGESNSGTCTGMPCDTQSYVNWVNQNGLCSFTDWRLPTVAELSSIAVMSNVIPAVDTQYFPNTVQPRFFTNQSLARDPSRAWYVYFSDGSVSATNKGDASHVRLVRGGQ